MVTGPNAHGACKVLAYMTGLSFGALVLLMPLQVVSTWFSCEELGEIEAIKEVKVNIRREPWPADWK